MMRNSSTRQHWLFSLAAFVLVYGGSVPVLRSQKSLAETGPLVEPYARFEQPDHVTSVAFHPDGIMLLSSSSHEPVRVSDAFTGGLLRTLRGRGFSANSISYSHSGDTLAIGCNDGKVRLLDVLTLAVSMTLPVTKWGIYAVAFSNDDKTLACDAADGTAQLWNLTTGKLIRNIGVRGEETMAGLAFSPDDDVVAAVNRNGRINVWQVSTGQLLGTRPEYSRPTTMAFCNDGKTVATGRWGGISLWDYRGDGSNEQRIEMPDSIRPPEPLPNAKGELPPGGGLRRPRQTFLSADCETAATVTEGGNIAIWSVRTRVLRQMLNSSNLGLTIGGGDVSSVSFSSDGKLLASGNLNGRVALWRLK
jgi:WD40 repeat protein